MEYTSLELVFALSQAALAAVALWNFGRLRQIKLLLRPQLAERAATADGPVVRRLLPPAYLLAKGRADAAGQAVPPATSREPAWASAVLRPWAAAARSAHEATFGTLGAGGPEWFLRSQKLVLFNAIVSVVVGVDLAIGHLREQQGLNADPVLCALVVPALLSIGLAPFTFLCYNWCTAVEGLRDGEALRRVLASQRRRSFETKLRTLATLCECFDVCSDGGCFVPRVEAAPSTPRAVLRSGGQSDDATLNLLAVFDVADHNGDGLISSDELRLLASRLGFEMDDEAVESFLDQAKAGQEDGAPCSVDGDCFLNFPEFAAVVFSQTRPVAERGREREREDETARRVFGYFDRDRSGSIGVDEMTSALQLMGFDAAGTEQLPLFRDVTGNLRDQVGVDEFSEYFAGLRDEVDEAE